MEVSFNLFLLILLSSIFRTKPSLLILIIQSTHRLINGSILLRDLEHIIFFKWLSQLFTERKIGKDWVSFSSPKISSKELSVIATFYQLWLELLRNILNLCIDCLSFKEILLIFMELGFSSRELGRLFFLMLVFLSIVTEIFVGLSLIIKKFGLCFLKKLGRKSMDLMTTFMLDTMMKG